MIEAGTAKPAAFDVVIVHSFSRFFRHHFELEFYVRKLAKNGVKLLSFTTMEAILRKRVPAIMTRATEQGLKGSSLLTKQA